MLNAEKYKDELKSLNEADKLWCSAFNKYYMTFGGCLDVKCENCAFNSEKGCSNGEDTTCDSCKFWKLESMFEWLSK